MSQPSLIGLRRKLSEDELANILGRNACRVIAQSLSGGTFAAADGLCSRYGDPASGTAQEDDAARKARQREHCPNLSKQ